MKTPFSRVFSDILYAQCWEDPRMDRSAFRIHHGDTVFSITSGGCNTLAFLADDPGLVYALDLNPHQNFLLELKIAAFAALGYEQVLEFLGVRPSTERRGLYALVREALHGESRKYWDSHQAAINAGIIHTGSYERYMHMLRRILEIVKGKRLIRDLFDAHSGAERLRIYRERWDTPGWRLFTRIFLSRAFMSLLFTREFFRFVDGTFSFGDHFAALIERALTAENLKGNYFASYILLGRYFDEDHLPPYLMRKNFRKIQARLGRIRIVTGDCGKLFRSLPDGSIGKFNFTNIFEWMSPAAFETLLRETSRVATEGAIITYRNLLVMRERPRALASLLVPQRGLARRLHAKDRSFIYRNYVVERVNKSEAECILQSKRSMTAAA